MPLRMHQKERPTCGTAGEALLLCGGRLAVRTRGVHPRNVSSNLAPRTVVVTSGAVLLEAARPPIINPGIEPRSRMTVLRNIARHRLIFQRSGSSHSVTDRALHEHPLPRQAN